MLLSGVHSNFIKLTISTQMKLVDLLILANELQLICLINNELRNKKKLSRIFTISQHSYGLLIPIDYVESTL